MVVCNWFSELCFRFFFSFSPSSETLHADHCQKQDTNQTDEHLFDKNYQTWH